MDFPASGSLQNKCLWLKAPGFWYPVKQCNSAEQVLLKEQTLQGGGEGEDTEGLSKGSLPLSLGFPNRNFQSLQVTQMLAFDGQSSLMLFSLAPKSLWMVSVVMK